MQIFPREKEGGLGRSLGVSIWDQKFSSQQRRKIWKNARFRFCYLTTSSSANVPISQNLWCTKAAYFPKTEQGKESHNKSVNSSHNCPGSLTLNWHRRILCPARTSCQECTCYIDQIATCSPLATRHLPNPHSKWLLLVSLGQSFQLCRVCTPALECCGQVTVKR